MKKTYKGVLQRNNYVKIARYTYLCSRGIQEWFDVPEGTKKFFFTVSTTKPRHTKYHVLRRDCHDFFWRFAPEFVRRGVRRGWNDSPWVFHIDALLCKDFPTARQLYVELEYEN